MAAIWFEEFVPLIPPGIKEPHDLIRVWITPRQVCALTQIAMVTGEREVFDVVRAAVLARVDVLDVKRMGIFVFLPQAAILNDSRRDAVLVREGPATLRSGVTFQIQTRFRFEDRDESSGVDVRFIFSLLHRGECSFIALVGKDGNARRRNRIGLHFRQSSCAGRIERTANRLQ